MTTQTPETRFRPGYLLTLSALAAFSLPANGEPMLNTPSFYRSGDMSRYVDNYVELGGGYNSEDSYKFGEWNGLREEGAYPIVGFNWLSRARNNDASYWQISGSGLGLETRKFGLELGAQGRWRLNASADRLVRSEVDSARFFHLTGLGTNSIGGIPANVTAVSNSPTQPYKIEQGRDFYRLGFTSSLGSNWDLSVNYREDVRDGTRVMGVMTAFFGAPTNVPYEIDDHTQQMDTTLAFSDGVSQLQFNYHFSRYENQLDRFTSQNPVNITQTAVSSLMPSNDYHQLTATGTHRFGRDTRLTAKLSYGLGTQNEAFLPYRFGGAVPTQGSLDGEVARTLFDLSLNTRPSEASTLKLGYQYFDHNNKTPTPNGDFTYFVADSATSGAAQVRRYAPLSTTEHKLTADADYRIASNTTLRGVLEYSQKDFELEARTQTKTTKAGFEARRPVLDNVSGNLGYEYTQRTGSEYDRYAFIAASYVNAQFTTYHPSLRAYMYNDFDENRIKASANWIASETISMQSSVAAYQQQFEEGGCSTVNAAQDPSFGTMPDGCLGRSLAQGANVNLDLQWQPEENFTAFTFLNYGAVTTEQNGRTWNSAPTAVDATRNWQATIDSVDHSVGTGFKWQPDEAGRWSLGGHYVFSKGVNQVSFVTGSALTDADLPDSTVNSHSVQLYAKWIANRSTTFRLNYLYETMKSDDWAYIDPATGAPYAPAGSNYYWTGQNAPRYENHVIGVSVALHSW